MSIQEGDRQSRISTMNYNRDQRKKIDEFMNASEKRGNLLSVLQIVELYAQISIAKDETRLIQRLFQKPALINQMIRAILLPESGKSKQQAIKQASLLKDFIEENIDFYELFLIGCFEKQLSIEVWFQFLTKSPPNELHTALGYFEAMFIPFITYDFASSTRFWDYCDNRKLYAYLRLIDLFEPSLVSMLVKHSHHKSIFEALYKLGLQFLNEKDHEKSMDILTKLFLPPEISDEKIVVKEKSFIQSKNSFQISGALQDSPSDKIELKSQHSFKSASSFAASIKKLPSERSPIRYLCSQFLEPIDSTVQTRAYCERVYGVVKELSENTNHKQKVFQFLHCILQAKIAAFCRRRVARSWLGNSKVLAEQCRLTEKQVSVDLSCLQIEEDIVMYCLNILAECVKILGKLQNKGDKPREQVVLAHKYIDKDPILDQIRPEDEEYIPLQINIFQPLDTSLLVNCLTEEVRQILADLPLMREFTRSQVTQSIQFSSGQNIKRIGPTKNAFLQLLICCLSYAKDEPDMLIIDFKSLDLLQLMERYHLQNRWNNLVHISLQKLACLVIGSDIFKTTSSKSMEALINFIIASFTNHRYVFLDSFQLTGQGDVYFLYELAKRVAIQLEKVLKHPSTISLSSNIDSWCTFVVNNLQAYGQKLEANSKSSFIHQIQEDMDANQVMRVNVDEVVTITQIVGKFKKMNEWSKEVTSKMVRTGSTSNLVRKSESMAEKQISNVKQLKNQTKVPLFESLYAPSVNRSSPKKAEALNLSPNKFDASSEGIIASRTELSPISTSKKLEYSSDNKFKDS